MGSLQTALDEISNKPGAWATIQSALATAPNPKARFLELAGEYGLSVDPAELDRLLSAAKRELTEADLDSVSGGFNPQPDPPGFAAQPSQQVLIGLLLPAVQKVRGY
jgi:hypothetical protein